MKVRPIYDNVIVKREEAASKSAGGLYIPENGKEAPARGEVLAVGEGEPLPDGTTRKVPFKAGDKVLFRKYAANDVTIEQGETVTIVRISDVIGVIEPA